MSPIPFKKLSETLAEKCPEIKLEDAKKVINAYRDYMFNLRNGNNGLGSYCDICYCLIPYSQANKTGHTDYNYCCDKHEEYKQAYNVERVRHELGIKVEHMPMLDIYG